MRITRFENAQRFRLMNRWSQLIMLIAACVMAAALAHKWLPLVDISNNGRHSLTPETVAYIESLPTEVEVVASLALSENGSLGSRRTRALTELLGHYKELGGKVSLKWVDGYRAQTEYGFADPYRVMVRSNRRVEWIMPDDLWERREGVERFMGERAMTSAIARVCVPPQKTVLLCVDSAKITQTSPLGLSRAYELLKNASTKVEVSSTIPKKISDYDLVCVWGGSDQLTMEALATLQRSINDEGGSLWVVLEETPSEALGRFLYYNGIEVSSQRVAVTTVATQTPSGEVLLDAWGDAPVVKNLARAHQKIISKGYWWGVKPRQDSLDYGLQSLLQAPSDTASSGWQLALASRRVSPAGVQARILVYGGLDWLANATVDFPGNRSLAETTLDWLGHGSGMPSIPLRETPVRQLGLSSQQLWRLGMGLGGCVLVLGLAGVIRLFVKPR